MAALVDTEGNVKYLRDASTALVMFNQFIEAEVWMITDKPIKKGGRNGALKKPFSEFPLSLVRFIYFDQVRHCISTSNGIRLNQIGNFLLVADHSNADKEALKMSNSAHKTH